MKHFLNIFFQMPLVKHNLNYYGVYFYYRTLQYNQKFEAVFLSAIILDLDKFLPSLNSNKRIVKSLGIPFLSNSYDNTFGEFFHSVSPKIFI